MSVSKQTSGRRRKLGVAIGVGVIATVIGSATPAYADDFNPQPDPPHVSLDVGVSGLSQCSITVAWPPGPTRVVQPLLTLTVPLAGIFPPDPCAPAPVTG